MNLRPDILAQAAFLPRPGSYRELRNIVGLIEERMAVLAERQRLDTGSNSSQMVDEGSLSDNKPGGMAVEGRWSFKNGPNCWNCGKPGHVQRKCKEHKSSGVVATIVRNGEPPVTVSTQRNFEANVHKEETTEMDSQIRSGRCLEVYPQQR
jgi:hypothetical protein